MNSFGNLKNIILGIVLVVVGIIWGLNSLEITDIDIFFSGWWTLFIIIPCFVGLFSSNNKTGNLIGFCFGTLLLLTCQDIIDFHVVWKLFFPIVVVLIGISLIFKDRSFSKKTKELSVKNNGKEYMATFSSQRFDFSGEKVDIKEISSTFGSINCNLRDAKIDEDIAMNVSAIFGGVDILVPSNVNVKVSSTSLFGGVDNKIINSDKNKKTIYITATCLFGGVDIK